MNQKMQRRVRREANRLLAKRRYRERKGGRPAAVWSVRVGPAAPKPAKRRGRDLTGTGRRTQERVRAAAKRAE